MVLLDHKRTKPEVLHPKLVLENSCPKVHKTRLIVALMWKDLKTEIFRLIVHKDPETLCSYFLIFVNRESESGLGTLRKRDGYSESSTPVLFRIRRRDN